MTPEKINPEDSIRSQAYTLWRTSAMPMVTLVKTIDVTRAVRYAKREGASFNMVLCWCIGRAADGIDEFRLLLKDDSLYRYDRLGINVIVNNSQGGINSCDIPYSDDISEFNRDYERLTREASADCRSICRDELMIVGTSAMIETELDCVVNQYTEMFTNPMVMWGKYRKRWFRYLMPVSFQFHHVQMDGGHAARFLARLQMVINGIK